MAKTPNAEHIATQRNITVYRFPVVIVLDMVWQEDPEYESPEFASTTRKPCKFFFSNTQTM